MNLITTPALDSIAGRETLFEKQAELTAWLFDEALPLQIDRMMDPKGGFFERLSPDGTALPIHRRARVSARQVYAFAAAARLGWTGPAADAADHALRFLCAHHISTDGDVIPTVDSAGNAVESCFTLYDIAFVLFALAHAKASNENDRVAEVLAERVLDRLYSLGLHPDAGFEDSDVLRANPHMHLLEAALAWIEAGGRSPRWQRLAEEVVTLCRERFIDPTSGAVRELFDGSWRPLFSSGEAMVEPGHQFEWAWLLLRWEARVTDDSLWRMAERLIEIGQNRGVNLRTGLTANRIDLDLNVTDPVSRLWPQTERVKALALRASQAENDWDRDADEDALADSVAGLLRYTDHPVRGSWWENLDAAGRPVEEPARTSSLYHIVGAVEALHRYTSMQTG